MLQLTQIYHLRKLLKSTTSLMKYFLLKKLKCPFYFLDQNNYKQKIKVKNTTKK